MTRLGEDDTAYVRVAGAARSEQFDLEDLYFYGGSGPERAAVGAGSKVKVVKSGGHIVKVLVGNKVRIYFIGAERKYQSIILSRKHYPRFRSPHTTCETSRALKSASLTLPNLYLVRHD